MHANFSLAFYFSGKGYVVYIVDKYRTRDVVS